MSKINKVIARGKEWFHQQGWKAQSFQVETWKYYLNGYNGILNAPTGSGKTYAMFFPIILEHLEESQNSQKGIKAIWIAPIRALTKEIQSSCQKAVDDMGLDWRVDIRSGDTSTADRKKLWTDPPDVLITTPESMHVIMSTRDYYKLFTNLRAIVADEWHELMGSKRGVQLELAISRMRGISSELKVWGISATIDNLDEAMDVLLGFGPELKRHLVKAKIKKKIAVESIIPKEIEKYPWAGHLGIRLLEQVMPIIHKSKSTLIFTNTRSQCEIWYQKILDTDPDLAGIIAMHHGSISRELRDWVETALHEERLKAVVCTSSLDLGVDFRPVENIIQIGSPKGVSRFIQRAGRSGHKPGAVSKIYFVPTHSLELVEGAALRSAIAEGVQEPRLPYIRSFDVLIQYLMTLAVSNGFDPKKIYEEVIRTHCYESMTKEEWNWIIQFLLYGGDSLQAYDEYQKVALRDGRVLPLNKRVSTRHKLSIGTIVGDVNISINYLSGKKIGTIEEGFISQIKPGETFWFAGRPLELVRMNGMTAQVKKSRKKSGKVPSWMGARMPLSSMLSKMMRKKMYNYGEGIIDEMELEVLAPLFEQQRLVSHLPTKDDFLIEYFQTGDGYHLLVYPFEGRFVHEGMGALLAERLSKGRSISFSIAMNDYGFELLSDKELDVDKLVNHELFSTKDLVLDIQSSMNSVEMARRKFRDIARISGMIFQGYPGKYKKDRHLQSSSALLFDVFRDYDPDNLLYRQTYDEVLTFQLEENRLRAALKRIESQNLLVSKPDRYTPFSFPIIVDRMNREKLSTETTEDRVKKLMKEMVK